MSEKVRTQLDDIQMLVQWLVDRVDMWEKVISEVYPELTMWKSVVMDDHELEWYKKSMKPLLAQKRMEQPDE